MPETDLNWLSATEQAALIRSRKVSPVEIVDALLARIDKVNPRLNAFVLINADQARREAKSAERAVGKRGARLGPLHGVPFGVKDLVVTRGVRTTFGTPLYRDNVPTEDAPMVERLKAAGGRVEPVAHGSDDAPRRRRGAHDGRLRGPRRARPLLAARRWRALLARARPRPQGAARRLHGRPRVRRGRGPRGQRGVRARGEGVPRARVPGRRGPAQVALDDGVLGADLLRRHRHAHGAVPRPARPDRAGPAPLDRGHAEEPADALRAGVVRSAELVAAPARLLREVRSAADADDRVRALQGRARHARGHRRPRRLVLRLDPVHARVQPHGPARGVRAVRIHEGRIANRIANRGSPLRRHARAPRLRGLRARAAVAPAATVHRLTSPLRTEAAGTRRRLNRRLTYWTLTRAASPTTLPA